MEFTVNTGKGYVAADRNRAEDAPIGLIPVDSLYSPVKKVSYRVENTREGQVLDYDKLTMTIETDGSLRPPRTRWRSPPASCRTSSIFVNFDEPQKETPFRGYTGAGLQPGAAQEGRRAGAFRAFGQLPEERQHRLYRRPDPEDRGRDAAHPELRPQVAERDQGSSRGRWASISAWKCRTGRRRTSKSSPSVTKIITEFPRIGGGPSDPTVMRKSIMRGLARLEQLKRRAMRHGFKGRRFNRSIEPSQGDVRQHRRALLEHEQIVTTLPKAKDLRPIVEKLVTLGKRGDLHARRQVIAQIGQ
jgi:hypothetical protein